VKLTEAEPEILNIEATFKDMSRFVYCLGFRRLSRVS